MKRNSDQFSKLSYDELVHLCSELQDKVTRTISLKQELIGIKNDLDKELNRFQVIEEFGREGIFQESIESFGVTAVEYFIQAFEQPHCLIAEYAEDQNFLQILASFGFGNIILPQKFDFDAQYLNKKEGFILQQDTYCSESFHFLELEDALVGPFFDSEGKFKGLVICGQMTKDRLFYNPINPKDRYAFTVMSHKAGYLLQNFRYNQKLKLEIQIRKAIEEELEAKANDLMRSNKDLEQFAYVVSHDLKAPLINIAGFAQILNKKYRTDLAPNAQEYLDHVLEGVDRFKKVIDALLNFSRNVRAVEKMEMVELDKVVERILRSFTFTISKSKAKIEVGELPMIQANPRLIEQLFQNLIANAIKFKVKDRRTQICIQSEERASDYLITVADNGIGIEADLLEDIFIPFRRLHANHLYDGNGIGLSICKKIIERHNGKIWATSEGENQGTTIYISFPK